VTSVRDDNTVTVVDVRPLSSRLAVLLLRSGDGKETRALIKCDSRKLRRQFAVELLRAKVRATRGELRSGVTRETLGLRSDDETQTVKG